MRAAIYTRVSSEEQVKGYSLAEQERVCREKALELGAVEVEVFCDEGVSGSLLERPALAELRTAVEYRDVKLLVCRDPDRLARNLAHQLVLADECEKNGVELVFTGWDWQKTPEGQLFFSIRGAVSQYEREKIKERMKRGKIQKARSGLEPNRVPVFGYRYDEKGRAVMDEYEAGVVKDIFHWFLNENISMTALAGRLEERGVPGPAGKRWYKQTVRYILSNSTYAGKHYFNKRDDSGIKNNRYVEQKAKRFQRERSEWVEVPYPAIVDWSAFERAREKLTRARRLWAGKPKNTYMLSGLLKCGMCQNTMTGMAVNYRKPRHPDNMVYTCRRGREGKSCRPNRYVKGFMLERTVWEEISTWLERPEKVYRYIFSGNTNGSTYEGRVRVLRRELTAIEKGRRNVLEALASGIRGFDETAGAVLQELNAREAGLKKQLEHLEAEPGQYPARTGLSKKFLRDYLERLSEQDKKALIRMVINTITVKESGGDINMEITAVVPSADFLKEVSAEVCNQS